MGSFFLKTIVAGKIIKLSNEEAAPSVRQLIAKQFVFDNDP